MSFAVLTTIVDLVRRQWRGGDRWKMLLPCSPVRQSQTLTLGGTWKRLSPQSGRLRASQENALSHLLSVVLAPDASTDVLQQKPIGGSQRLERDWADTRSGCQPAAFRQKRGTQELTQSDVECVDECFIPARFTAPRVPR
jgi:hypothetical protein